MTDDMRQARELLAMCLDEWGIPTEATNVRAGEDLESYESDFRLLQQLRAWGLLQYPQEAAAPEGWSFQRLNDESIVVTADGYGAAHVRPDDSDSIASAMLHLLASALIDASPKGGSLNDCPIIRLAPGEYTYWEKRVWRRGVIECATQSDIAAAMQPTSHGAGVSSV